MIENYLLEELVTFQRMGTLQKNGRPPGRHPTNRDPGDAEVRGRAGRQAL
ncbi:hypothetical protein HCZ77_07665 [Limosilactobacillus fermentum]